MFVWVDAADVAHLRDSKSNMIVYAVVFFASAAQSHYAQDPNAGTYPPHVKQKCTEMLLVQLGPVT